MMESAREPTLMDQFLNTAKSSLGNAYDLGRALTRNAVEFAKPWLPVDSQGKKIIPDPIKSFLSPVLSPTFDRRTPKGGPATEGHGATFPPEEIERIKYDVEHHVPIRDIDDLTTSANSLDGSSMSVKLNTKYPEQAKKAIEEWNKLGGIHIKISGGGALDWWDTEIKDTDIDHLPKNSPDGTAAFYGQNDGDSAAKLMGEANIYLNQTALDSFPESGLDNRTKNDYITAVIAHELGHSMGMDHSLPGNVMYYSLNPGWEPDLTKNQTTALGPVDIAVFNQIHHRASGGDIKGPGSSIGDKIPAYLSDGEFVVNAASASANRPLLKAINDDPTYMKKYMQQMESVVASALTKVRATPNGGRGERVDRSMTVRVSTYDVHEAFAKAKLWEQRHALLD